MGVLLTAASTFSLEKVTSAATSVLTWFLSSFGSIFNFFLEHDGLLVFVIVGLVGTALVYFRKLI